MTMRRVGFGWVFALGLALAACGGEARSEGSPDQLEPADTEAAGTVATDASAGAVSEDASLEDQARSQLATTAPAPAAPAAPRPSVERRSPADQGRDGRPGSGASSSGDRAGDGGSGPPLASTDRAPAIIDPQPEPEIEIPTVRVGQRVVLRVDTTLSTETHSAGDRFTATVVGDVLDDDGLVLIPSGAVARGVVVRSAESPNAETAAVLDLDITSLIVRGREMSVRSRVVESAVQADFRDSDRRTAGKVAAGAAAGAILGRVIGGSGRDAVKGGVVGAAAGAAVAVGTKDGQAKLDRNAILVIEVTEAIRLIAP